ncbi:MAG: AMP-binding protein [Gammaproteobacteria bacterium]|nr:AMP-binding protein [Gammaproteobacteria bacterium]
MNSKQHPIRLSDSLIMAADKWPTRPAITFQGKTQTWQQTLQRCHGAATLLARSDIEKGDRVAFLGLNSNAVFESYFSPSMIGAIMVPINYRLSVREMVECVEDCTPKVLIVDPHFIEQAEEIRAQCACIITVIACGEESAPATMLSYEDSLQQLITTGSLCELSPSQGDETVIIFYTGGTTGRSKGVMLSNINFKSNTDCSIPLYRMQEGWNFIILGPLFHLAAGSRVFSCTTLGGHAVILPKFDVQAVLQNVEQYRINSATLVPTMFQMLLDALDFDSYDLSSLKMLAYGAAPMSMSLLSRVIKAFPGVEIFQTFGMTEAAPILTSLDSKYHVLEGPDANKLGSVGTAVSHVELIIVDEDGREQAAGETGQILARGNNIMTGYWQQPELTAAAMQEGWYHTGDAGYLDGEGFLFLEGRVKDMIVSGGENVYPIEVENVLAHHPAIKECAVIGVPHQTWGEAVHAVVVLEDGKQVDEAALIKYCKDQIAHYKCPVSVSFRDQPMPLSPINKILKTELRKPFWV